MTIGSVEETGRNTFDVSDIEGLSECFVDVLPGHFGEIGQVSDGKGDVLSPFTGLAPLNAVEKKCAHGAYDGEPFAGKEVIEKGVRNILTRRLGALDGSTVFMSRDHGGLRVKEAAKSLWVIGVVAVEIPLKFVNAATSGFARFVGARPGETADKIPLDRLLDGVGDGLVRNTGGFGDLAIGKTEAFVGGIAVLVHPAEDLSDHVANDTDASTGRVGEGYREKLDWRERDIRSEIWKTRKPAGLIVLF